MEPGQVICPYNKAHIIDGSRIQVHLIKCRKNYPDDHKVACLYNNTHIVASHELEYHLKTCSDLPVAVSNLVAYAPVDTGFQPPPILTEAIPTTENWDSVDVPTYEPSLDKRTVLRSLKGAPPSERKQFRNEERRRLATLHDTESYSQTASRNSSVVGPSKLDYIRKPTSSAQSVISVKSTSTKNESRAVPENENPNKQEPVHTKSDNWSKDSQDNYNAVDALDEEFPSLCVSVQNRKKDKRYGNKANESKMTMAERIKNSSQRNKN